MREARRQVRGRVATGSPPDRLRRAWRALPGERRLAASAAFGLFLSLFLPWYQETVIPTGVGGSKAALPSAALTGWAAFSFVEAAVLVVAAAVLVLLFMRAEDRAFHVPGGDGGVITAAGLWTCLLIVWRMFDKQGTAGHGQFVTTSGIEWGIFIALGIAALLAYAGSRIKLANEPEPPLPGEQPAVPPGRPCVPGDTPRTQSTQDPSPRRRRIRPPAPAESVDKPRTQPLGAPSGRSQRRPRPHRGLDFSELEQIKFDEPPEPPIVRRRAPDPKDAARRRAPDPENAASRRGPDSEDPLTARLDRPD